MNSSPAELLAGIGRRLAERARRSVIAHRDHFTVRRVDQVWSPAGAGCQQALLWQGPAVRTTLFRLARGAALPWHGDVTGQEILVLEGRIRARGAVVGDSVNHPNCSDRTDRTDRTDCTDHTNCADIAAEPLLIPWAYALRSKAEAGRLNATDAGALVYVRQLLVDPTTLPEPEAQWWQLDRAPLHLVLSGARRWRPNFPGVEVLPLWGNAKVASMLVRFAAGAGVPDHAHAVQEDCLMLEGDMFLGDILLRPGDYQRAAAGSRHFGEMSDVGGTFFFHGAIDPVLRV